MRDEKDAVEKTADDPNTESTDPTEDTVTLPDPSETPDRPYTVVAFHPDRLYEVLPAADRAQAEQYFKALARTVVPHWDAFEQEDVRAALNRDEITFGNNSFIKIVAH